MPSVNLAQHLNRHLRSQDTDIYRRWQEYEVARHEQNVLRAELQSGERVLKKLASAPHGKWKNQGKR